MIDTLNLALDDFQVDSHPNLRVQPHPYQADTGVSARSRALWIAADGCPVEGVEAKYIAQHFTVTLKPPHPGAVVGCYVQLSLPKFYLGNNLMSIGLLESQEVMRVLEGELCKIGVHTSLKTAQLARLDLFRNIQTDEPFTAYNPLFRLILARRRSRREWTTTFLWQNTQQETVIYDKGAERQQRGYDVTSCPTNTMRCEHRFKTGDKIKSVLRGRTMETLWSEYSNLGDIYNNAIRQTLFKTPVPDNDSCIVGSQMEREMHTFKSVYGRNWLPLYLQALAAIALREENGLETFQTTFTHVIEHDGSAATTQQRLYRLKRDMNQAVLRLASLRTASSSTKTLGTLYRELESKLILANR